MTVTVLTPDRLGAADIAAWQALQHATPALASPFLSPEFTRAVGRHRSTARIAVLSDGSGPVGYFPYERHSLGLGLPIGSGLCDVQGLVHAPGLDWDAQALLRACGLKVWRYDHLAAGQRPFDSGVVRRAASPVIDLAPGYAAYAAGLRDRSPARMSQLEAKERRLTRRLGEPRLVFEETAPERLETLMRWKSAQYRAKEQVDLFGKPSVVALLRGLMRTRSDTCTGTLSTLYAGERPVAMHFGLRSGRVLQYWFPAYDPEAARFSPGLLLLLRMARAAAAQGVQHLDLGKGDERYKQEMKTGDLPLGEGWVTLGTLPAALRHAQTMTGQKARALVAGRPGLRRIALRAVNTRRPPGPGA
ncbi:GNAT family N-acetyltransferase [Streptomyces triticiradicis]|uniref:GNAT family N-acetyltransferase n=1 Tax=Streptomyces triticiradicis TaxID=2651189 RepID=A0A7J5DPI3_9ACTN|nr:GNAT family N-acetyltransferase [Streptomyces triticiradicis]KAB1990625.1 GNAT family N-acetyltransferase [Streptomyces triticiradicis]